MTTSHCTHFNCNEVFWGNNHDPHLKDHPGHAGTPIVCVPSDPVHWRCSEHRHLHSSHTSGEQGHVCLNVVYRLQLSIQHSPPNQSGWEAPHPLSAAGIWISSQTDPRQSELVPGHQAQGRWAQGPSRAVCWVLYCTPSSPTTMPPPNATPPSSSLRMTQ